MNKWKRRILCPGLCLLASAVFSGNGWAASYSYSTEMDGQITTGDIAITLREYEREADGTKRPFTDGQQVLPGQQVSKIVRITNEAQEAWIRAKAQYREDKIIQRMDDSLLGGIEDAWIRCGEYYYYTVPVAQEEAVDFFRTVTIPESWDKQEEEKTFCIDVTAQAIQAANFLPDFSEPDPWFGIPVEECVHSSRQLYESQGEGEFAVIFENGSEGFFKTGEDFFSDFGSMLPGDRKKGVLTIGNHFKTALSIWFRTEVPEGQPEASEMLLSQMELTIRQGDTLLYQGPLHAKDLEEAIVLVSDLERGQETQVTYEVFMPEDLNNASALQTARVRWIFSTQYRTASGGSGGSTTNQTPGTIVTSMPAVSPVPLTQMIPQLTEVTQKVEDLMPEEIRQIIRRQIPKLGDSGETKKLLAVMTGSGGILLAMLLLVFRRKKGRS